MLKDQLQLNLFGYATCALIAMVILVDFALPGTIINDQIVDVKKERQQSYNAARSYHYSYKIITNEHKFLVEKEMVEQELRHERVEYAVSPIFQEVNWYRLLSSSDKSFHSLRLASGLILPIITTILIFVALRFNKKLGKLVFIAQVLLPANLIFLLT